MELPIAVSSKQVRDVLRSELSTSVPVAKPAIAMGTSGNQPALLHLRDERERTQPADPEVARPQEGLPQTGDQQDLLDPPPPPPPPPPAVPRCRRCVFRLVGF